MGWHQNVPPAHQFAWHSIVQCHVAQHSTGHSVTWHSTVQGTA